MAAGKSCCLVVREPFARIKKAITVHSFFGSIRRVDGEAAQRTYRFDFENLCNKQDSVQVTLDENTIEELDPIFLGYALDEQRRCVIFGTDGLRPWITKHCGNVTDLKMGSFLAIDFDRGKLHIWTDYCGNMPCYYYVADDFLLFSDSLYVICERLKKNGIAINYNRDSLLSRSFTGRIANQLISDRSPIDGIAYLVRNQVLRVEFARRTIGIEVERKASPRDIELSPEVIRQQRFDFPVTPPIIRQVRR